MSKTLKPNFSTNLSSTTKIDNLFQSIERELQSTNSDIEIDLIQSKIEPNNIFSWQKTIPPILAAISIAIGVSIFSYYFSFPKTFCCIAAFVLTAFASLYFAYRDLKRLDNRSSL